MTGGLPDAVLLAEIAGIRFRQVAGPTPGPPPPHYDDFLAPRIDDRHAIDLPVEVLQDDGSPLPPSRVFRAGEAWSLARDGSDRMLIVDPPVLRGAAWCTARFPPDVSRVRITTSAPSTYRICYPIDQLLMIYRLSISGGLIIHGAGFGRGAGGYIFPGVSGAGKTTIARLLRGRGWETLSDDRIVIRDLDAVPHLFGTPWPGEGRFALNEHRPLRGIVFLRHGPENALVDLPPLRAAERLLTVASIPWFDPEFLTPSLEVCDRLVGRVPARELTFRPDPSAARFLEESLG